MPARLLCIVLVTKQFCADELFEIQDIRNVLCDIIAADLCPSYGDVERWVRENCDFNRTQYQQQNTSCLLYHQTPPHLRNANWNSWPPDRYSSRPYAHSYASSFFHSFHDDYKTVTKSNIPIPQRRKTEMRGWGDDLEQYYVIESMLKLNPGRLMYLYENVATREGVERYIEEEVGSEWFWDNGQTWMDSWAAVLVRRGLDLSAVTMAIADGKAGIIGDKFGSTLDMGMNHVCEDEDEADEAADGALCL